MATWCVYHHIHVRTPHELHAKLFITDVPAGEVVTEGLVEEYYCPSEFGIPWANHGVSRLDHSDLRRQYRNRHDNEIPSISFARLKELEVEDL